MDRTENHPQYFTATIVKWQNLLKPDKYKDVIVDSLAYLSREKIAEVNSFVIMSNHIHLIWQIKEGHQRERVQANFLKYVAQTIQRDLEENHPRLLEIFLANKADRKYQFWKRRPLSIDLWTKEVFLQKMEYIHANPVKAGLCVFDEDYKYSSARFYKTGVDDFGVLKHWME
jgi:putative transposase